MPSGRGAQVFEAHFRIQHPRVDLKRPAEISDGSVFVALLLVCVAPVEVGKGIPRVKCDGLVYIGEDAWMPPRI